MKETTTTTMSDAPHALVQREEPETREHHWSQDDVEEANQDATRPSPSRPRLDPPAPPASAVVHRAWPLSSTAPLVGIAGVGAVAVDRNLG
jgi:hypothetical protein